MPSIKYTILVHFVIQKKIFIKNIKRFKKFQSSLKPNNSNEHEVFEM